MHSDTASSAVSIRSVFGQIGHNFIFTLIQSEKNCCFHPTFASYLLYEQTSDWGRRKCYHYCLEWRHLHIYFSVDHSHTPQFAPLLCSCTHPNMLKFLHPTKTMTLECAKLGVVLF
jgi:hypothetical protein